MRYNLNNPYGGGRDAGEMDQAKVIAVGIAAVVLLILSVAFAVWASRTYRDGGKVTAMHWEHHTLRDHWSEVTREGWRKDLYLTPVKLPVNGVGEVAGIDNIRNCYDKFHHTNRVYVGQTCSGVGKHRHCRSNYRYDRIYLSYCTYDTWAWVQVEDQEASGDDAETRWIEIDPGTLDRVRRESAYDIGIEYYEGEVIGEGKFSADQTFQHVHHPTLESDFRSWKIGERVAVECYNIGWVRDVIRIETIPVE